MKPAPAANLFNLTDKDLEMFRKIGVDASVLGMAQVRRVNDAEACEKLHRKPDPLHRIDGILFPYLSPATGKPNSYRVRLDVPLRGENGRAAKYLAGHYDAPHLYFPHGFSQFTDWPIILVEAEKSVLAILTLMMFKRDTQRFMPVGMGGCWGFRGKIGKKLLPDGNHEPEKGVLPELDLLRGRQVYICLDANVTARPDVWQAQQDLANELRVRECDIKICRLPQRDGVNGPDDLIGIDPEALCRLTGESAPGGGVQNIEAPLSSCCEE